MQILAIDYEGLGLFIGGASLLVGILTWWLGKLLSDKKDSTIHEVEIQHLKERVDKLEEDVKDLFQMNIRKT